MNSPIIESVSTEEEQKESEAPIYIPELLGLRHKDRSSRSIKNKEMMLGKLLSKGFNFGIYTVRRSHYVRDEA